MLITYSEVKHCLHLSLAYMADRYGNAEIQEPYMAPCASLTYMLPGSTADIWHMQTPACQIQFLCHIAKCITSGFGARCCTSWIHRVSFRCRQHRDQTGICMSLLLKHPTGSVVRAVSREAIAGHRGCLAEFESSLKQSVQVCG